MDKAISFVKKNRNYVIWAGCAIMAIAVFLNFVTVKISMFGYSTSSSVKFTELTDHGNEIKAISAYFVLIAAAASAVLVYLKKEKYSLISTAAALVITFYDLFKVKDELGVSGVKLSYTAPWIVLIGAIVAVCPIVIDILEDKGVLKTKKAK